MTMLTISFLICASLMIIMTALEPYINEEKQFDLPKFLGWVCAFFWCLNASL
jgi:hypothetical protein